MGLVSTYFMELLNREFAAVYAAAYQGIPALPRDSSKESVGCLALKLQHKCPELLNAASSRKCLTMTALASDITDGAYALLWTPSLPPSWMEPMLFSGLH